MSEIRANTVSDAAGTGPATLTGQWASKFYTTYNIGTGSPVENESGNVTSYTDNGTGRIGVTFTNNFNTSTYSISGISAPDSAYTASTTTYCRPENTSAITTSGVDLATGFTNAGSNGDRDYEYNSQHGFGDLA